VRSDKDDPHSKGSICPKARALRDIHHDPDRLRRPLRRTADGWEEMDWDDAFDLVAERLRAIRKQHGRDAIAVYQGNPSAHNPGLLTLGQLFVTALNTQQRYSASSVDQLPHMVAAYEMLGHQWLLSPPDIDRTDLLICMGANPVVSNGSLMTAPNVKARFKAIRDRGGRIVVIDPRRSETAALADEHLPIRPGTDALFLLSMAQVIFSEHLVRTTRPVTQLAELRAAVADFSPEATATATGIEPDVVRRLGRDLADTERAVLYGRVGLCTQEFGGLAAWLLTAINAITGHLDEPGGPMVATPAADPLPLMKLMGAAGSRDTYRSRVRGLPEVGGELPAAVLAEEIDTPGEGRVRALVVSAGNPVLSTPNGARLERALPGLDFMVSIDFYLNETSRHADVILPPTAHLERSHYDLLFALFGVRNNAKYSPPAVERGADQRHDWEICAELLARLVPKPVGRVVRALLLRAGPERLLDLALRAGPYGLGRGGLSLERLRRNPHGLDLGPLQPQLPKRASTDGGAARLTPEVFVADLARLRARHEELSRDGQLVLIGRRHLRTNNSWMHNSVGLMDGVARPRCTLLIHPDDAARLGVVDGEPAAVMSAAGVIELPAEVSDEMMPGVVSVPHGWGHDRKGTRLGVAGRNPGVSVNDLTDEHFIDALTGTAALSGVPVTVTARQVASVGR
jgi:anaerobic selenocysteine-containing dehydrogenase